MKKKALSLLTALCLMLSLVPAAFAADISGLQDAINGATNGVVDLTTDYTITETVAISNGVTINGNGHTITYNGTGSAFRVTAQDAVVMNNLTINAKSSGAYGIDLTSSQPDLTLDVVTLNVHTRGVNMYPVNGCAGGKLTIQNSSILNSQKSDYANETTVGDTRGIALFDVKNSSITMENSSIKGFGYSINTSNNLLNGIRAAGNTYNISDSNIWGWSAFNIWTVGNTYNLTNCDMRGLNPLTTNGNSFSLVVLNQNIYGSNPNSVAPNVFNISGGVYVANATGNSDYVEETLFRVDDAYRSEFHFDLYEDEETYDLYYVNLICNKPFTAFVATYNGMTSNALGDWASTHVTGNLNTIYTWDILAPGMNCAPRAARVLSETALQTAPSANHEGGETA